LADGGVIDNLGVGFLLDSYRDGFLSELVKTHQVSTLVFIVVNAQNRAPEDMDRTARAPGVTNVVVSSMNASIARPRGALARALEELRDAQDRRAPIKLHAIEVNLEDLADEARRERLLAVGTNYGLSAEDVHEVTEAGRELLLRSPAFERIVASL